jgi:adenylate kinase family enzyme
MEPEKYTDAAALMPPPARITFIGGPSSGKSTILQKLSVENGIPKVEFASYVSTYIRASAPSMVEEYESVLAEKKPLPESLLSVVLGSLFNDEPYQSKGFFLEGFPTTKAEADFVIKNKFHFDCVVHVRIDPEVAVKRHFALWKTMASTKVQEADQENVDDADPDTAIKEEISRRYLFDLNLCFDASAVGLIIEVVMFSTEKESFRNGEIANLFETQSAIPAFDVDANRTLRQVISAVKSHILPYIDVVRFVVLFP